jgi:hypothetical protein
MSLNFYASCTFRFVGNGDPLVLMVGFWWEGILLALPNLTFNCPQVGFRILFYNDIVINLDCDLKNITLGGKPPKVRYIGIWRWKGELVSKAGEKRRRKNLGANRHVDLLCKYCQRRNQVTLREVENLDLILCQIWFWAHTQNSGSYIKNSGDT